MFFYFFGLMFYESCIVQTTLYTTLCITISMSLKPLDKTTELTISRTQTLLFIQWLTICYSLDEVVHPAQKLWFILVTPVQRSHLCCCEWSTAASLFCHLGESRRWVGQKQTNKTQMFTTLAPPQLLVSPLVCVVRWEERERINNGTHPFGLHLVAHFW